MSIYGASKTPKLYDSKFSKLVLAPYSFVERNYGCNFPTLESGINVKQGINVGPGNFGRRITVGPGKCLDSWLKKT